MPNVTKTTVVFIFVGQVGILEYYCYLPPSSSSYESEDVLLLNIILEFPVANVNILIFFPEQAARIQSCVKFNLLNSQWSIALLLYNNIIKCATEKSLLKYPVLRHEGKIRLRRFVRLRYMKV